MTVISTPPVASQPPRRRFYRLSGLLLTTLSILFSLLTMEVFLRVIGYPPLPPDPLADHNLGTTLPPNLNIRDYFDEPGASGFVNFRTNNMGFREDSDTSPAPPPGTERIVILGDSQTACNCPVAESYPHQLGEFLNHGATSRRYEVINAGVARHSPYQYYVRAKLNVLPVRPTHIIVGIYIGNDLVDLVRHDDRPYLAIEPNGSIVERPPVFVAARDPAGASWSESSRIYTLVWRSLGYGIIYQVTRARMLSLNALATHQNPVKVFSYLLKVRQLTHIGLNLMTQSLHQYTWFQNFPETLAPALTFNKEVMRLFQQMCRQNNVRLTYLIVPAKIQIEPEDMTEILAKIQQYDSSLTADKQLQFSNFFADQIIRAAARLNVEVVDPRPEMLRHKSGQRLYYKQDMHLTAEGNRVLAAALASYMVQHQRSLGEGGAPMRTTSR